MKYECDTCGKTFNSKKKILTHLENEASELRDVIYNSEDELECLEKQINETKKEA